jgi:hypothetical protein
MLVAAIGSMGSDGGGIAGGGGLNLCWYPACRALQDETSKPGTIPTAGCENVSGTCPFAEISFALIIVSEVPSIAFCEAASVRTSATR